MANITEILGTDSVSSSRPVINSNFELLNDELATVTGLLDPTTAVLSGLTNTTTQELNVVNGSTLFRVSTAGALIGTAATFSSSASFGGSIVKSGVGGSASAPVAAPTTIDKSTYFMNGNYDIPAGADGQEVTLINKSGGAATVTASGVVSLGATSISLDGNNSTVTLRCFENVWYVISSYATTIS
jgi:hypothetical protein